MYTAHETILSYMTLSENVKQVGYPVLHEALKLSWYKLFKKTKESIVRKWVYVEDGGLVNFPNTLERLQGVYVVDDCGDLSPLFEDSKKGIIPKLKDKCSCNACDKQDCMCPSIQDSIVQTEVLINSIPYSNKVHTRVLKNGDVVEEKFTWVPVYDASGGFVRAQEVSSQNVRCTLSVSSCGCPSNCAENISILTSCGCLIDSCIPSERDEYPALYNGVGYYKTDDENRVIHLFNSKGKKSNLTQVMLSFQSNGADMLVPDYARAALIATLDETRKRYSPSFTRSDRDEAKRHAYREKMDMLKFIHPIPYPLVVKVDDARRNQGKYYNGVHSDFIKTEAAPVCIPAKVPDNVTNITYATNVVDNRFLKVIVGQSGGPVNGASTYQNNAFIGFGSKSSDKVEIVIDKVDMYNWGDYPDFSIDKTSGTITMFNDYKFQTGSTLKVDLNQ